MVIRKISDDNSLRDYLWMVFCILIIFVCLFSACNHWQQTARTSLAAAHNIGIRVREIASVVCRPQLEICKESGRDYDHCPELKTCHEIRDPVLTAVNELQEAVKTGLRLVDLGEEKTAQGLIAKAVSIAQELINTIERWGFKL